jgi:hypothetical protein
LKDLHIIEILKEQKIYDEVSEKIISYRFYDSKPVNGIAVSLYAFMVALFPIFSDDWNIDTSSFNGSSFVDLPQVQHFLRGALIIGIAKGVALSMAVGSLYTVCSGRFELRNIENKINKIDVLIKKVEAMEHEESPSLLGRGA